MKLLLSILLISLSACTISPLTQTDTKCPNIYIDPIIVDIKISDITDYCPALEEPPIPVVPKPRIIHKSCVLGSMVVLSQLLPFDTTPFESDPNILLAESLRRIQMVTKAKEDLLKEYMKCR